MNNEILNNIEDSIYYDFKNEFNELYTPLKLEEIENPIEKFFYYYTQARILNIDCDVCLRSIITYLKYEHINGSIKKQDGFKHKYEIVTEDMIYRGDTMTSFWTIYKNTIQSIDPVSYKEICNEFNIVSNQALSNQIKLICHDNFTEKIFAKSKERLTEENQILMLNKIEEELNKFAKRCHTIGNFIPVPTNFNNIRCGIDAKWDSWDLTLKQIYNWYYDNRNNTNKDRNTNDEALIKLLSKAKDNTSINNCKKWLNKFTNFEDFIDKNYLQDFIEDGKVKMYYESHSLERPLPKTKEEILQFLTEINKRIESRSKRIHDKFIAKPLDTDYIIKNNCK